MVEVTTNHHIQECPLCGGKELIQDYKREEIYCNNCGLILSDTELNKHHTIPHSPSAEARNNVHVRWVEDEKKGNINPHDITRFHHNMSDEQIMRWGQGRHLRPLHY